MNPRDKITFKKKKGIRSPWREFEFWFMVVQQAIIPKLSLRHALEHWDKIKEKLMENTRKRELQTDFICSKM